MVLNVSRETFHTLTYRQHGEKRGKNMISLEYAIQTYKDITNLKEQCPRICRQSCNKCMEEHKQLIEWLEELKELRELKEKESEVTI